MSNVCLSILPTSFEPVKRSSFGFSNATEGTSSYVRGLSVGFDLVQKIAGLKEIHEKPAIKIIAQDRLDTTHSFISHLKFNDHAISHSYINLLVKSLSDRLFLSNSYTNIINELDGLRDLADGWSGTNSIAPSSEAIEEAKKVLINVIEKNSLAVPTLRVVSDGEVNFYWNNEGFLIDMAFFGEGEYSYYYKNKLNGEEEYDDVPVAKGFSSKMLELLSW